jgi:hypothetical protein
MNVLTRLFEYLRESDVLVSLAQHEINFRNQGLDGQANELMGLRRHLGDLLVHGNKEINALRNQTHLLESRLSDAQKAGTPCWSERDKMNALVLENERLREQIKSGNLNFWDPLARPEMDKGHE